MPTVPAASEPVATVSAGGLTVIASAFVAVAPLLSLTWTVKPAFDAAAVGVPPIVPPGSSARPCGSEPEASDHE